ncbi:MAG TPA: hypothetical protein VFF06_30550, partial [Polyangia bacterium]|nr:hypothetical protein [Polyangia bacterium]
MAEEKKGVGDISEALKSIFERIGDFFSLFDLSFLVSGAVCLGAVVVGAHLSGTTTLVRFFDPAEWPATHTIAVVLICYVLGLVCFALGRIVQAYGKAKLYTTVFPESVKQHGLMPLYGSYFEKNEKGRDASATLYATLWVQVRQLKSLAPSLSLLM